MSKTCLHPERVWSTCYERILRNVPGALHGVQLCFGSLRRFDFTRLT